MDDGFQSGANGEAKVVAANYSASENFAAVLANLPGSLLVSTYQAGQLCSIGSHLGQLTIALEPFNLAMGIALHPKKIAVGSRGIIWILDSCGADFAKQLSPPGTYDAAIVARTGHVTGNMHGHEMAFSGERLWVVNTLFSCLVSIEPSCSFVPRWKPKFISNCHAPGDRCHLNGLAMVDGRPEFVTAMSETDEPNSWRSHKEKSGVVMSVRENEVVARGFAMPHSPRVHAGHLWVLDSGRGQLVVINQKTGKWDVCTTFPGYTRGLTFAGPYAFVGLSKIRETAVFGGVPIAANRDELKCGVGVVEWQTGKQVAAFQFLSGVEEIFDVQFMPMVRNPFVRGPQMKDKEAGADEVWIAPPPRQDLNRLMMD